MVVCGFSVHLESRRLPGLRPFIYYTHLVSGRWYVCRVGWSPRPLHLGTGRGGAGRGVQAAGAHRPQGACASTGARAAQKSA